MVFIYSYMHNPKITSLGYIHKEIKEKDREYICPNCGVVYDRDIHAAENMIWIYENIIGVERTDFKRVDFDEQLRLLFER